MEQAEGEREMARERAREEEERELAKEEEGEQARKEEEREQEREEEEREKAGKRERLKKEEGEEKSESWQRRRRRPWCVGDDGLWGVPTYPGAWTANLQLPCGSGLMRKIYFRRFLDDFFGECTVLVSIFRKVAF